RRERKRYLNDCEMKRRRSEKRKMCERQRREKKTKHEAKSAGFRPRLRRTAGAHSAHRDFIIFPFCCQKEEDRTFARKMAQSSNPDNFFQTTFVPTIGSLFVLRH